jgi:hypothetical protein
MKLPIILRIKPREPDGDESPAKPTEMLLSDSERQEPGSELRYVEAAQLVKAIADIATCVWKARTRMTDTGSGQVREEMKRIYGDTERIYKCLDELGIVVKDHTGETFDYGLPLKVITTKPMPISVEIVTETFRPTIYWQDTIIQHGEVEVGTPIKHEESR